MKQLHAILTSIGLLMATLQAVQAKPVAETPLGEAIEKAPIILLAEGGPKEYDNLKQGQIVKTHSIAFDCRKQAFKILKIYRNKTAWDLQPGKSVEINNKSNGCLDFEITIERKGNKLTVKQKEERGIKPYSIDIKNDHEKVVLFLQPAYNPKFLEHYGWFVSPEQYNGDLEKQIADAKYSGPKHGVHLTSGCDE
ncbi:MAG: hypothetical protein K2X77_24030 [Candidatus Obscuribacterales bacterium]|nr:hypothetical protein [Candidatus Obscuribacterales bacterium]